VPRTPFPIHLDARLDTAALGFAVVLACLTALLSGLLPAWRASRPDVGVTLKAASPTSIRVGSRLRQTLVAAQIALSAVLLVCAALFARSLQHAAAVDPGFSMPQGFLAAIDLQPAGYDESHGTAFVDRLLDRVSALPHVTGATAARTMPFDLGGSSDMGITVDGYTPQVGEDVMAYYNHVAPHYFDTMGIAIVRGRAIAADDGPGRPLVAVVNETMARRYWQGRDPVGATIRFGRGAVTVVGVARDGKYQSLTEAPRNYLYLPLRQNYYPDLVLHVATDTDPALVLPSVRSAVHALDPDLPLFDVRTIDEHMRVATFVQRVAASLLGVFGALGLFLAAVGLYGVISFNAAQRTGEIGLRVALGADRLRVFGLIVRDATAVIGLGLGVGMLLAFAAGQLVSSQLSGVSGADPLSFVTTAVLLGAAAFAACAIPAWRAAGLDPLAALRRE
jgi:predicted permease